MKPLIAFCLLIVCLVSQSFLGFSSKTGLYPIFDAAGIELPRNLRTFQTKASKSSLNIRGLNLRVSGSGQFSESSVSGLIQRLKISPDKLVVLDLRQESHGFINGQPVSWTDGQYNYGNLHKSRAEIEADEYQRLRLAAQARRIVVDPIETPTKLTVQTVRTERAIIEEMGSAYVRLPVTDHNRPSNEVIDQFVDLVKNLTHDHWVHFHCKAGKGRTTTFLTLYDIIKNAQEVSLNDILKRQKYIGGIDLRETQKNDGERTRAANERLDLVKKFYLYCQQVPNFQIPWSEWIEQQQSILVQL